tara:strand:- start:397 stop:843 length:447 start_codon:yes stop_codon:yes gene_type:complete
MMESSIEIIKRKLILYATAMDTRNWSLVDDVFHKDATAFYGDDNFSFEPQSREEILIMCKSSLGGCGWTQHMLTNFRILNINSDEATSACYVRAYHVGLSPNEKEYWEMFGEYQDKWKLFNGDWVIEKRILRVDHDHGNRDKVLAPGV